MNQEEIKTLAKFATLWTALPVAVVTFIGILVQLILGLRQVYRQSCPQELHICRARFKAIELDRCAVTSWLTQRREEISKLRDALIEFYNRAYSTNSHTAEDIKHLHRLYGEIQFRALPNNKIDEDLVFATASIYA